MAVLLEIVDGPQKGLEFRASARAVISIGRDADNDLCILERTISRSHASVRCANDGWIVEDRGSTHGVWIEGVRTQRARIRDGTLFRLGARTVVRVTELDAAEPASHDPAQPDPAQLVGQEVGSFRVIEPIVVDAAPSAEGVYFRAHEPRLARPVTLGVFGARLTARPGYRDALGAEVRRLSRYLHPNLLQVLDFGEARGLQYIVLESFDGVSLARLLAKNSPLGVRAATAVGVRLLDALTYVWEQGERLRSVATGAVLVSETFDVKLWLFEAPGGVQEAASELTAAYTAPEVESGSVATQSGLVYSAAAVLYHMLAGAPPFAGGSADAVRRRARSKRAPALRRVNLEVGRGLSAAIETALSRAPGERPASLREFRDLVARATTRT